MGSKETGDISLLYSRQKGCQEMKIFHDNTKLCVPKAQLVGRKRKSYNNEDFCYYFESFILH